MTYRMLDWHLKFHGELWFGLFSAILSLFVIAPGYFCAVAKTNAVYLGHSEVGSKSGNGATSWVEGNRGIADPNDNVYLYAVGAHNSATVDAALFGKVPFNYSKRSTVSVANLLKTEKGSQIGSPVDARMPIGLRINTLAFDFPAAIGTTKIGLYDPGASAFYLKNSNAAGPADFTFGYGNPSFTFRPAHDPLAWKSLVGDWNGDGIDTLGLYHQEDDRGVFYLRNSNTAGVADLTFAYGPGRPPLSAEYIWIPLSGNWDGL